MAPQAGWSRGRASWLRRKKDHTRHRGDTGQSTITTNHTAGDPTHLETNRLTLEKRAQKSGKWMDPWGRGRKADRYIRTLARTQAQGLTHSVTGRGRGQFGGLGRVGRYRNSSARRTIVRPPPNTVTPNPLPCHVTRVTLWLPPTRPSARHTGQRTARLASLQCGQQAEEAGKDRLPRQLMARGEHRSPVFTQRRPDRRSPISRSPSVTGFAAS
ncbi:hypothetical protein AcW1_002549 [Taiwanofungus camphoratus]|nr:hypothetical protein AcW1_002549 [Antrodia cinnamomea]